jgi:hypothetical protein
MGMLEHKVFIRIQIHVKKDAVFKGLPLPTKVIESQLLTISFTIPNKNVILDVHLVKEIEIFIKKKKY